MPVEHFKSKEAERKNLAYRHMHGIPYTATTAVVAGVPHKVEHSTGKARLKIDNAQRKKEMKDSKLGIRSGKGASGRTGKYVNPKKKV